MKKLALVLVVALVLVGCNKEEQPFCVTDVISVEESQSVNPSEGNLYFLNTNNMGRITVDLVTYDYYLNKLTEEDIVCFTGVNNDN
jgi:uncharacterized protein YcfL